MKNNHKTGILLSLLGIFSGLLLFYLLASQYNLLISVKTAAGRIDEATSVQITYAVLGWFGLYWIVSSCWLLAWLPSICCGALETAIANPENSSIPITSWALRSCWSPVFC